MTKTQKQKYVPMRMCLVTRVRKPKNELIRIVRTPEDKVVVDIKGKVKGRGANIEKSLEVFEKATQKNMIPRALKMDRKLSIEEIDLLRQQFESAIEEKEFRKGNKPVKIRVRKGKVEKLGGLI